MVARERTVGSTAEISTGYRGSWFHESPRGGVARTLRRARPAAPCRCQLPVFHEPFARSGPWRPRVLIQLEEYDHVVTIVRRGCGAVSSSRRFGLGRGAPRRWQLLHWRRLLPDGCLLPRWRVLPGCRYGQCWHRRWRQFGRYRLLPDGCLLPRRRVLHRSLVVSNEQHGSTW